MNSCKWTRGQATARMKAKCTTSTRGADMKIGIIGAGHIGGTLVRRLRALGHDVSVANSRGPATLKALADETGARDVSVEDGARDKDLVVVTIPGKSVPKLPKNLFGADARDTIVVDTGN